ncbi:uncharacterized protein [Salminus brasiliensis]|uniref:uncharacterized protein n=1 Tax=Salminus brasiliensis TaxID=930266 RepID=UPI003B838ED0
MLVLLVIFDLLTSSSADTFSLVVPDGSLSAQLGSSVVLPCALSPSLDSKDYEIRWYRPNNEDNPVLLYKDLQVQENAGHPQYRGRVSLVGDLLKGNVSLKLENLTLADRGEYVCFVSSYKWYEKKSDFLTIPVVGSPPLLTLGDVGDQVNITCESGGWSPNTTLIWKGKRGRELRNSVDHYTVDSEGLVSVSSWLMFSPTGSEWISCSVGLSDQEMREGRVLLFKPASATLEPGVSPGWIAFIILLVISLLVLALLITPKIRGQILPKHQKATPTEEEAHPFVADFNPPPFPVCTLKETNTAEESTQTSGEVSPQSSPVSTGREINRADGATQTSGDFDPPPCPVCTLRETNTAEESTQTSGEGSPQSSPVSTGREINRADGATQTSDFNPPPCPVCTLRETNTAEESTQASGEVSPQSSPVSTGREINRADGATQTSGEFDPPPCPVCTLRETNTAEESTQTSGEGSPQSSPVSTGRETNTAEEFTQASGQFSSALSFSASAQREIPRTDAAPPTRASERRAKELNAEGNADWDKMLDCRVAIKAGLSDPHLGVLFKERMRGGQFYWVVTGLTGSSAPAASLSKSVPYQCPNSWYVGVISETVMKSRVPLTPQNSCWVLHYDKENGFYVNDPSQTPVLVRDRFTKLGVFLDCEKHTLSFYSHDKRSHLYTFYNVDSTEPLVPVVFPGLKPKYSLEILNA